MFPWSHLLSSAGIFQKRKCATGNLFCGVVLTEQESMERAKEAAYQSRVAGEPAGLFGRQ